MPRDADLGLHFLDELARRRAADRLTAHDSIALGLVRRRVTDHQQWPHLANAFVAGAKSRVDLVFAEFHRRAERRDIRTAASEDSDSVNHKALAVQRDSLVLEKWDHFAFVQVARQRKYRRACAAHVGDDLARIVNP